MTAARPSLPRLVRPTCLALATLAVAGCAGSAAGDYPSLAIRDVERQQGQFTPATTPPATVPVLSAGEARSVAEILAAARAAHGRFAAATAPARRAVLAARGAAAGSRAWGDAQVALSNLESLRSVTAVSLADADRLHARASAEGLVPMELDAARATIADLVADEDTTLAALRGTL